MPSFRRTVALSTLLITGHQLGEAAVPFLIGVIIDRAVAGGAGDLVLWLGVLGAVYVGLSFSFRYGARTGERASYVRAHDLRLGVTSRVLSSGFSSMPGALTSIATSDAARVGGIAVAITYGIASVVAIAFAAVLLLSVSVPLGLLVLLGTPPLLLLTRLLGKPLERRSEAEQEHSAHASGIAADLVAGLRVVKGLRASGAAVARYRARSRAAYLATVHAARAEAAHDGLVQALSGTFLAAVAVVGGVLAARGSLTVGGLISAVGLAQFLVGPMSTFGWVGADLAQGRASARRITAVLSAPPAVSGGTGVLGVVRGCLSLQGVSSGPLRAVDLSVAPGTFVGVVAFDPAAAGELVRVLGRSVDPASGVVSLDGVALTSLSPDEARKAVLAVDHHTDLFEGTVHEAIFGASSTFGDPVDDRAEPSPSAATFPPTHRGGGGGGARANSRSTLAAVEAAAVDVDLGMRLDDRARVLSGGQRQRIALARALAADPAVLVLHDPTTAVDAVTEARIAGALRALRDGRTTLLITTSPALLAVADRVVVLDDGVIRADGTHGDLVAGDAAYREVVLA